MHDSSLTRFLGFYSQPYNEIVKPDQVWPVSKYFLRRWTPYLNPTRFWMVIAARQLAYRLGNKRRFECYDSLLYQEACASRANFYRIKSEIDQADSPISLFVSREPIRYQRQDDVTRPGPTVYYVRLDDVLTPGDAIHLSTWLQATQPDRRPQAVVERLQHALNQPPAKLLAPTLVPYVADPPARFQATTVADIVGRLFGPKIGKAPEVRKAADALHTHLTASLFIGTQYFRKYWLNLLGAGPAILITYLRSLCYLNETTGEARDEVTFTRPQLADALGIDRATLFRWLKKIEETTPAGQPFSPFMELIQSHKTAANEVESTYRVQLHDPLVADHLALYHERSQAYELAPPMQNETHTGTEKKGATLQNETHANAANRNAELQNETHTASKERGSTLQNETHGGTQVEQPELQNETHTNPTVANLDSHHGPSLQNETVSVANLDSYKYLNTLIKALENRSTRTFAAADAYPELWSFWKLDSEQALASFARAAVVDLEGFCQVTNIQGRRSRNMVANSGLALEQLVAWHLYALTQKGINKNARPGYIVNQAHGREPPPADFQFLAALSWELWRCYACLLELPPLYSHYFQNAPGYKTWMAQYGRMRADTLPFGVGEGVFDLMRLMLDDNEAAKTEAMTPAKRSAKSNGGCILALTLPSDNDRVNWEATLGELELQMTKATFNSWLKDAHLLGRDEDGYVIGVHNQYAQDWLTNRLHDTVARTLGAIMQEQVDLRFAVWNPDTDSVRPTGCSPL
jgi:hypothetical protein